MKIGFIGGWGHALLAGLIGNEKYKIDTIGFASDGLDADRARGRAKVYADRGVKVEWFDDAATMLDQFKPDAADIGAIYGHNGDFAAMCLERDIPTACEKPVASTWEQFHRLEKLTAGNGRVLVTEFPFRSNRAMRAARHAVQQGLVGDIVLANGQKSYRFGDARPAWYGDRAQYTGTILWVSGHAIDFVRFATGQRFTRVYGQQGNVSKKEYGSMEETSISVFQLENGGHAIVHSDYNRPAKAATHGDDRLRIAGSKGLIEVLFDRCMLTTHDEPEKDITESVPASNAAEEMYEALQSGGSEIYGTAASLEIARVLLLARDAADQQRVLDIPG